MRKYALVFLGLVGTVALAVTTPLMNLNLPDPGVTSGPVWAQRLNTALTTIDSHNHTTGQGAKVPVAGLNINADLGMGGYNLSSVNSSRYVNQGSPLAGASDVNSVYVSGGELYYNDAGGAQVKITDSGSLNIASLGTIGGDYGGSDPASVFYTNATKTYTFTQSSGVTGKVALGDIILYETVAAANGITIKSPTSLASSYTLTMPPSLPASNRILAVSSSGAITAGATNAVQTGDITDGAVTQAKRAALGQQVSSSSGTFSTTSTSYVDVTNLSVTITTTGRPVSIKLIPDGGGSNSVVGCSRASGTFCGGIVGFVRASTTIADMSYGGSAGGATSFSYDGPTGGFSTVDIPSAGTYTYKVQIKMSVGSTTAFIGAAKLLAYEL